MKKKSNWGFVILGLLALFSLSACTNKNNNASVDTYERTSVMSTEPSSTESVTSATDSTKQRLKVTVYEDGRTEDENLILKMFNQYYEKDFGVTKFDVKSKTYYITPYRYAVADGAIMASRNPELYQSYKGMVDSLQELSSTLVDKLGLGYTIEILNPRKLDHCLVAIKDGVIIYDISR